MSLHEPLKSGSALSAMIKEGSFSKKGEGDEIIELNIEEIQEILEGFSLEDLTKTLNGKEFGGRSIGEYSTYARLQNLAEAVDRTLMHKIEEKLVLRFIKTIEFEGKESSELFTNKFLAKLSIRTLADPLDGNFSLMAYAVERNDEILEDALRYQMMSRSGEDDSYRLCKIDSYNLCEFNNVRDFLSSQQAPLIRCFISDMARVPVLDKFEGTHTGRPWLFEQPKVLFRASKKNEGFANIGLKKESEVITSSLADQLKKGNVPKRITKIPRHDNF